MSLAIFENFLNFAESAIRAKADLPFAIDAAEIENALVNYGVVLLHAHMEQCLRSAFEARCARCSDFELRTLTLSIRDKETGKIGLSSVKDTLARFSKLYKQRFKAHLDNSGVGDGENTSWESVKNQRHAVAHNGQPATCSLADLRLFYGDIRKVLGFFCDAIGLSQAETAAISPLIELVPAPPVTAPVVSAQGGG